MGIYLLDNLRVAPPTGIFCHGKIHRRDLNWLVKSLRCEGNRVIPSVERFDGPFAYRILRRVAVVAHRNKVMAGFHPCIEVVSHDMAVRTGLGIIRQVRAAACVPKDVEADSGGYAYCHSCQ